MGKWAERLAALTAETNSAPPPSAHCQNCQKSHLTVLAVGSEGYAAETRAADADRKAARIARLGRWGWPPAEVEALAERLAQRDSGNAASDVDDRVNCAGCAHYRPGRCGNHEQAGLHSPEVGHDLARLLQRCPGFDVV